MLIPCDAYSQLFSEITHARTIAISGAGGKTTIMFFMASRCAETGKKVITTTSTHIYPPTPRQSPLTVLTADGAAWSKVPEALLTLGRITVGREIDPRSGKLKGLDAEAILRFSELADCTIIEADGAAGRPIKAPEAWEPVIPQFVDVVVFVIGLDALGQRVDEKTVFRVDRFCEITGLEKNDPITPEALARLAYHPRGGLKGAPPHASLIILLNKMDQLSRPQDLDVLTLAFEKEARPKRRLLVLATDMVSGSFSTVLRQCK